VNPKSNIPSERLVPSKEVLEKTGVSRVTLHNYIKRGFIPPPVIGPPPADMEGTRKIGYFPPDVVEKILFISNLKREGFSLAAIARKLNGFEQSKGKPGQNSGKQKAPEGNPPLLISETDYQEITSKEKTVRFRSIAEVPYPCYMVSLKWEIDWVNAAAEELLFGEKWGNRLIGGRRNLFLILLNCLSKIPFKDRECLITLNAKRASLDIPSPYDDITLRSLPAEDLSLLGKLWVQPVIGPKAPLEQEEFILSDGYREGGKYLVLFCRFREGTLAVYVPFGKAVDPITDLLSDRAKVLGDLYPPKQLSFLPICTLVAQLQNSAKISAALVPSEYFEVLSDVNFIVEESCRKYQGKRGEAFHRERLVGYFLAEPESSYRHVLKAFMCALEVKEKIAAIDLEWKVRKRWSNTICLNIGIHEGREWAGSIPPRGTLVALGDSVAEGICEVARNGALWTSKHTVSLLPADLKNKMLFGIRRSSPEGEVLLFDTFSLLMDLVDLDKPENVRFVDIKTLSVTELLQGDLKLLAEFP